MEVARVYPHAITIDGKILVKGGLKEMNYAKCVEVFDPKTQSWNMVSFTSDSKEWQSQGETGMEWQLSSCCIIDDVVYLYHRGGFAWFDAKLRSWRFVRGLEGRLPKFGFGCNPFCADYGGKIALLWDRHDRSSKCQERIISCAVVALERCSNGEISGTVEWSDAVLKVPKSFAFVHVVAATV